MKRPKGFFTYFHHAAVLDELTDAQAGQVYKALMNYGLTGEMPDFSSNEACRITFTLLKTEIDFNFERYREICEKRQEIAKEREAKRRSRTDTLFD